MQASVSNIELFRCWRQDEDLDLAWLISRLESKEQTPQMKAGEAFHAAIEQADFGEMASVSAKGFSFDFNCECAIEATGVRELSISAYYGNLLVRGRVDSLVGKTVVDYKTTAQFDPDRLLSSYQWRFYLDMMDADRFRWNVFVLRETDDPLTFVVSDFHQLEQARYPNLHTDCLKLANAYADFAKTNLPVRDEASLYVTAQDVTA